MADLPSPEPSPDAEALLATARALARELRPGLSPAARLGLDDSLERDFGLDSLARVELVTRLEHRFGVKLAEAAFAEAETPADLWRMIVAAEPLAPPQHAAPAASLAPAAVIEAPPEKLTTLIEVLDWHAANHGERVTILLYEDDETPRPITYRELQADARALARGLLARGLEAGERVAIMLPTGRDFLAAFYGTLVAGGVPVPLYPPARPSQIEDHLRRIAGVVDNAGARLLITIDRAKPLAHLLRAGSDSMRSVATVADITIAGGATPPVAIAGGDIAFLQYTSGSTGNPKGVVLTHANLLANLRAIWQASGVDSRDTVVSWLPLYHDMGLIGAVLGSMFIGCRLVLMSPLAFLARPSRWLWAIHEHRATLTAAPNFAYELCAGKLDERDLEGLDLSCWRLAFNGAEPVAAGTIERFAVRFAPYGFRREAMMPVYGLAESSVGLAFPPQGRGPRIDRIDRRALIDSGVAQPAAEAGEALAIVGCGVPLPGHEIRVVDGRSIELPERRQGRIQFRGPSSTSGYFGNPQATARLIEGDWLNTGDLGYQAGGEIFITGREKDIIIRGGHNIHPHELEEAVAGVAGVRKGGVAVFPASDPGLASERLIVLAETTVADADARQRMHDEIARLAIELTGGPADDIVLAPPRTVRKTSSGKIRRAACRELYERGELARTQRPPWQQLLSLAADAVRARWRTARRAAADKLWGLWAWLVFVGCAVPVAALLLVVPGLDRRRRLTRAGARLGLALVGLTPRAVGDTAAVDGRCAVWVANHASYLDALVLGAVLPPTLAFVSKQELVAVPVLGHLLQRLGCAFVERFDAARGVEDTDRLLAQAASAQSLFFFPEGTLRRAPGVRAFRLGAFIVAARAGLPVVPVTLAGTRSVLRDGQWWPRRGRITVQFGAPIEPGGSDWQAALTLRDAARQAILNKAGEPDLAG